jgi:hypothetical protein
MERSLFASCRATEMYSVGNFIWMSCSDRFVSGTTAWYLEICGVRGEDTMRLTRSDLVQSSLVSLSPSQLIRLGELAELRFGERGLVHEIEHEVHREEGVLQRVCVLRIQINILFRELDDIRRQER